jgi:hypothetical protein
MGEIILDALVDIREHSQNDSPWSNQKSSNWDFVRLIKAEVRKLVP